jgi:peptide/nickel transport system permease protein
MRVIDAMMSIPMIVLLLAIVRVIGVKTAWGPAPPGLPPVMIAMVVFGWAFYARLTRGQALVYRQSDFVAAARVAGLSQAAIVVKHIGPGVGRLSLSYAVGDMVGTVVLLASLPFLGAGVQAPHAEWGAIMYEGRGFLAECWWVTLFPGLVLVVAGLGLSLVADAVLDARKGQ